MSKTHQTQNPATEENIQEYTFHSMEEANAIVDQCHDAFLQWRGQSTRERAKIIRRIGEELRSRKDSLCELMTKEMGKPISQGAGEVDLCAAICDYTADHGPGELADEARGLDGGRALITYQPLGVILGIQPWNFPFYQAVRYSIACLMAGNGVLLKHARNVWGCALELEDIYRSAGLPEHLFSVLKIGGSDASELVEHPKVRGVTFTGSPGSGAKVAAAAGKAMKKSVLELGSNDAYIVLDDANMEKTLEACVQGRIFNNGETCVAAKRFIVVDSRYDEFKEGMVERMAKVKLGDPTDPDTDLGPMARGDLRDDLHQQVKKSVEMGAECLTGGELPEGSGFFYPATVLANLKPGMPAFDEELFGPVASLIRVKDEKEAMEVANSSRYGLGGGIFSENEDRAIDLARESFDTGMVCINGYRIAQPQLPFGGVKDSGYGREHGGFGIKEFINAKAVMIIE